MWRKTRAVLLIAELRLLIQIPRWQLKLFIQTQSVFHELVRRGTVGAQLGKYALKERLKTWDRSAKASHHTFQSETASFKPVNWLCSSLDSSSSASPTSSDILSIASLRSTGESQRVVAGKSGKIKIAQMATNTWKKGVCLRVLNMSYENELPSKLLQSSFKPVKNMSRMFAISRWLTKNSHLTEYTRSKKIDQKINARTSNQLDQVFRPYHLIFRRLIDHRRHWTWGYRSIKLLSEDLVLFWCVFQIINLTPRLRITYKEMYLPRVPFG